MHGIQGHSRALRSQSNQACKGQRVWHHERKVDTHSTSSEFLKRGEGEGEDTKRWEFIPAARTTEECFRLEGVFDGVA